MSTVGRKKIPRDKLDKAVCLVIGGFDVKQAAKISGLGVSTIYRELQARGLEANHDLRESQSLNDCSTES